MKYKKGIVIFVAIWILAILFFIGQSFGYDYICKNRVYEDLKQGISEKFLSANVHIVKCTAEDNVVSYSAGFCGVIFKEAEEKYYILTAYHAVDELAQTELRVKRYGDLGYNEYNNQTDEHVSLEEYYAKLPIALLEYYDEKYDLAILSFQSETNFETINVANQSPEHNERLICISQPSNKKIPIITYGKVTSKNPITVTFNDGSQTDNIIKHSAYEADGSSGSGIFNENYELAGINLGGGTDIFHNFRYGYAMPAEKIIEFLGEWKID